MSTFRMPKGQLTFELEGQTVTMPLVEITVEQYLSTDRFDTLADSRGMQAVHRNELRVSGRAAGPFSYDPVESTLPQPAKPDPSRPPYFGSF